MKGSKPHTNDSGMALLIVLWFVLVMGILSAMIMGRGDESAHKALTQSDVRHAKNMADGGVYRALSLLMAGDIDQDALRDGFRYQLVHDDVLLNIHIRSENRKLDPNTANENALNEPNSKLSGLYG